MPDCFFNIGEIVNARELIFSGGGDWLIVLQPQSDERSEEYIDCWRRFPKHQIKRTSRLYIDDTDGLWFSLAVADCFDPPVTIIRARSMEAALEVFEEEFSDQIKVDDDDDKDTPENERHYNGHGVRINTENIVASELELIAITFNRSLTLSAVKEKK